MTIVAESVNILSQLVVFLGLVQFFYGVSCNYVAFPCHSLFFSSVTECLFAVLGGFWPPCTCHAHFSSHAQLFSWRTKFFITKFLFPINTTMWSFFVLYSFFVAHQVILLAECLFTMSTIMWSFFVMYGFLMARQITFIPECLFTTHVILWHFLVMHSIFMVHQVTFTAKCLSTWCGFSSKRTIFSWWTIYHLSVNVSSQCA